MLNREWLIVCMLIIAVGIDIWRIVMNFRYKKSLALLLTAALASTSISMITFAEEDVYTQSQNAIGAGESSEDYLSNSNNSNETTSDNVVSGDMISDNFAADPFVSQSAGSKPIKFNFPTSYTYGVDASAWSSIQSYNGRVRNVVSGNSDSLEWAWASMMAAKDGNAEDLAKATYDSKNDPLGLFDDDVTTDKTGMRYGNSALATFILSNSTSGNGIGGRLKSSAWVPTSDINAIKGLIYKYGSAVVDVYMNLEVPSSAYMPNDGNHFFTTVSDDYAEPNHELVLVGWSDIIYPENFTNTVTGAKPSKAGAFKALDMNGKEIWISYEDATFTATTNANERRAIAYDFSSEKGYDNLYAYDGAPDVTTREVASIANIFTISANAGKYEAIKEVGFAVADPGKYQVLIYSYPYATTSKGSPFTADNLIETKTVDVSYTGYTTVKLDMPVLMVDGKSTTKKSGSVNKVTTTAGKSFAVEVRRADESKFNAFVSATDKTNYSSWATFEDLVTDAFNKKRTNSLCFYRNSIGGSAYVSSATPRIKVFTDNVNSIKKVSANGVKVELPHYVYKYTGSNITPKVIAEVGGYRLNSDSGLISRVLVGCKDYGIARILVSSNVLFNNYQGTTFGIVSANGESITKAKVYGVENKELRDDAKYDQTDIYLTYNIGSNTYVPLIEGIDYTVQSQFTGKNINKKKLALVVSGNGAFRKTKKVKFSVRNDRTPLADDSIQVTMTYENKELNNFDTVDYTGNKIKPSVEVKDTRTGETLQENVDYKVRYIKCKKPGVATVKITAIKEAKKTYFGDVKKFFKIKPVSITGATVKDRFSSYKYTGSKVSPSLNVALNKKKVSPSGYNVYTINNISSKSKTDSVVKNRPTAYVFGVGKYEGYAGQVYYTISTTTNK